MVSVGVTVVGGADEASAVAVGSCLVGNTPIALGRQYGSGVVYDASSLLIFSAFSTPPDTARKALINTVVLALKAAGVWALLDFLHVLAAADSQAALINWKNPGTFNAGLVNAPAFVADRGFTGNGTTSYVSSNFNPSTAGGQFVRDSAYYGFWSLTTTVMASVSVAGYFDGTNGTTRAHRTAANEIACRLNQNAAATSSTAGAQTDGTGLHGMARSGAAAVRAAHNGVDIFTFANASTALSNGVLTVGYQGVSWNTVQFAVHMAGANLTQPQELALCNALQTYLAAVGAVSTGAGSPIGLLLALTKAS